MKKVLVATVGLSPIPVALSILTLSPDIVVLVCSAASRIEAERIARVVATKCSGIELRIFDGISDDDTQRFTARDPETGRVTGGLRRVLGLRDPFEPLSRPDSWEPGSFGEFLDDCIGNDTGFILDYTGGTKVMVSAMVEFHTIWHGADRPDLRCYVAGRDDGLRFAKEGKTSERVIPLSSSLTLEERGQLNGYRFTEVRCAMGLLSEDMPSEITAARSEEPVPPGDESSRRGFAAEALLFELAVLATRKTLPEASPTDVEVLVSVKVSPVEDERKMPEGVAEFDLLWRLGNLVVVGEVKSHLNARSVDGHVGAAVTRAFLAPEVLGDAVTSLFWSVERSNDDLRRMFEDLVGMLGEVPALGYGGYWLIRSSANPQATKPLAAALGELVGKLNDLRQRYMSAGGFDPWISDRAVVVKRQGQFPTSADLPDPGAAGEIVRVIAVAGGSPLCSLVIGDVPAERRHLFMTKAQRPQLDKAQGSQSNTRPFQALELRTSNVALSEADLIRQLCGSGQPGPGDTLCITPGTKAVAAAMTSLALRGGADLLHVDATQDVMVTRAGRADLTWAGCGIDWVQYLRDLGNGARMSLGDACGVRAVKSTSNNRQTTGEELKSVLVGWAEKNSISSEWRWPGLAFPVQNTSRHKKIQAALQEQLCPDAIMLHERQVTVAHACLLPHEQEHGEQRKKKMQVVRGFIKQRVGFSSQIFGEAMRHTVVVLFGDPVAARQVFQKQPFSLMSERQRRTTSLIIASISPERSWEQYRGEQYD